MKKLTILLFSILISYSVLSEGTFIYWHKEGEKWKEENITNGGKDKKITYWINGNKWEEIKNSL